MHILKDTRNTPELLFVLHGFYQTGVFGAAAAERESVGEDGAEGPTYSRGESSSERSTAASTGQIGSKIIFYK